MGPELANRCYLNALELIETENGSETMGVIGVECMGCGLCQVVCPTEAIRMELTRDEDFVPAA